MTNTTITNFRKNAFEFISGVVNCNDVVNITTKEGNAVMLSESEYNGMIETLYLYSVPGMKEALLDSLSEPIEDMTDADSVEW